MGMVGLGVGVYVQYTRNTKGELGSHSRPGDWRGGGILLVSQLKQLCSGLWKIRKGFFFRSVGRPGV